ncbi:MAG TPA: hypothetical protein VI756_09020, partial [Blastocatellia bacterium]
MSIKPINIALFVLVALALPGAALAQRGGGGGGGVGAGSNVGGGANPGTMTGSRSPTSGTTNNNGNPTVSYKSITGTIVELDSSENSVSIKNKKDGKVTAFTIFPKTKLKAEKKTELADKKDL